MSAHELETLSVASWQAIDSKCLDFESAWKAGRSPQIEMYLLDTAEPEKTALLKELLAVELQRRSRDGDTPQLSAYRARFPEREELVAATFRDALAPAIGDESPKVFTRSKPADRDGELRSIGQYQLLEKLGAGGMGTVYKALHTSLDKTVALKVLPPERMRDEQAVDRFRQEMKALAKLEHPNIVRATDGGEVDGVYFLVMDYVEGVDLAQLIRRANPLPIADACEMTRQALIALQHAHDKGLIHRDVKPANLMLTTEGHVKLLDLGLARLWDERRVGERLTSGGVMMGTADYMAPEQAMDTRSVDVRTDIYSLGCTLFHLLCGCPPFHVHESSSPFRILMAHAQESAPSIQSLRADVPAGLASVVGQLLAKEPAQRMGSAAAVAEALLPFTNGYDLVSLYDDARTKETGSADLDTIAHQPDTPATGGAITTDVSAPTHKPGSRRLVPRYSIVAITVSVVLVLGSIGYFSTSGARQGRSERAVGVTETAGLEKVEPSRKLALWIFEQRGNLVVEIPGDSQLQGRVLYSAAELPGKDFHVSAMDVTGRTAFTDAHLTELATLIKAVSYPIDELRLGKTSVTGPGLEHLRDLPINKLFLYRLPIRDEDVNHLTTLPNLEALSLGYTGITDNGLETLKRIPTLTALDLSGEAITDDGLKHLQDLKDLRVLQLWETDITNAGLMHLGDLHNLTELFLGHTLVTDEGLAQLRRLLPDCIFDVDDPHRPAAELVLRMGGEVVVEVAGDNSQNSTRHSSIDSLPSKPFRLQSISFSGIARFDDEQWTSLCSLIRSLPQALGLLHIDKTGMTNENFASLSDVSLESLQLYDVPIDDLGASHIGTIVGLRALTFQNAELTDNGLAFLDQLDDLTSLNFRSVRISNRGLDHILPLSQLTSLELADVNVTAEGLVGLKQLQKLASLKLRGASISNAVIPHLRELGDLTRLELIATTVDDEALADLSEFDQLTFLDVSDSRITPKGVASLRTLLPDCDIHPLVLEFERNVAQWVLSIGGTVRVHGQVTAAPSIQSLEELPENAFRLLSIDLYANDQVRNEDLDRLKGLQQLEGVTLARSSIDTAGARHLAEIPSLKWIYLGHTKINNEVIDALLNLQNLDSLGLGDTFVSDEAIERSNGHAVLTKLELTGEHFTDRSLAQLKKFPKLGWLELNRSRITDEGLRHLVSLPLVDLNLSQTNTTDTAVPFLQQLTTLKKLNLEGTRVSASALAELREALPSCRITAGTP
ncbi:MAG: protein kinase [Planctomycetota bacterium]|nr:protein kinase [Planctomycetota bacterium]